MSDRVPGGAPDEGERPLKLLFFMRHAGYVRNFGSTLRLLADRGHQIHLAFDRVKPTELGKENLQAVEELSRSHPRISWGLAPARTWEPWAYFGHQLRLVLDYLRYLRPEYRDAAKLRRRAENRVPRLFRAFLRSGLGRRPRARRLLAALALRVNDARPLSSPVTAFIEGHRPDAVLLTPLVELGEPQTDYIRCAQAAGIPTMLCVASWDNLTNKGVIRDVPDAVTVWNGAQLAEATELHGVPESRVVITGAQPYDQWFRWEPSTTREEFFERVGLEPGHNLILYLCSSSFIAPDEAAFVRRWVEHIRRSENPRLRTAPIVVRPHPQNSLPWRSEDLVDLDAVAIWPPLGADPTDERSKSDFYDSLHHSDAVVGVNTSALIESAVVGRPVLTVLAAEFEETQQGTLHFAHLRAENGGPLREASTLAEHLEQLLQAMTADRPEEHPHRRFLESFIRPHGLDQEATPRLASAIEERARAGPAAAPVPRGTALGLLFTPIALLALIEHRSRRLVKLALSLTYQYAASAWRRLTGTVPPVAEAPRDPLEGFSPGDPAWTTENGAGPGERAEAVREPR